MGVNVCCDRNADNMGCDCKTKKSRDGFRFRVDDNSLNKLDLTNFLKKIYYEVDQSDMSEAEKNGAKRVIKYIIEDLRTIK